MKNASYRWLIGCWLVLLSASCSSTKYLKEGEQLLLSNEVKLESDEKIPNKRNLVYELTTLYKQTPNTNTILPPFVPREWWWFYVKNKPEEKQERKANQFILNALAETPVIYSDDLAQATAHSMQYYLQNKGYFEAEVAVDENIRKNERKIDVTYLVQPNELYTIDTTIFISSDTVVQGILDNISKETILAPGTPVSSEIYTLESNRITSYLRNHGYAFFYPNFIAPLQGDSSSYQVQLELEVLTPGDAEQHPIYTVGDVLVFPDYDPLVTTQPKLDTVIDGVQFYTPNENLQVRPQVLMDAIQLRPGDLYQQGNYDRTNQRLNGLGVFRFVSVKQEIDSLNPSILNYRILLTRASRMEFGTDVEVNYADRNLGRAQRINLIGLALNLSLSNRNLFRGAESLTSNIQTGVEINPQSIGDSTFWNTIDIRLQGELSIPKFVDYLGLWGGIYNLTHKNQEERRGLYGLLRENGRTRIAASYNFVSLLNFYNFDLFNATFGYDVQRSNNRRVLFNHIGIDYLAPETQAEFDVILDENPFLARSFGEQLFTGFLLRDASFIYNTRPNRSGSSWYFGANLEFSGLEVAAANSIYNAFALEADTFRLGNNVDFSRYVRLELDHRYTHILTPRQTLAFRLNYGVATPFGLSSDVPYVKQFFIGGPGSIRAFNAREAGPGSYRDPLTADPENRLLFYQTGDVKLEFNVEYRLDFFEIFSTTVEGATFLDVGNVWTLRQDNSRIGSQFLLAPKRDDKGLVVNDAFYKQLAVGTGVGLRFDFSYFIFRFDMGYPLRIPSRTADNWVTDFQWRRVNYNIALGYPF